MLYTFVGVILVRVRFISSLHCQILFLTFSLSFSLNNLNINNMT
jgi:hypothetical protein